MRGSLSRSLALVAALTLASCGAAAPAMAMQSRIIHASSRPGNRGLFNDMVPPSASRYGRKGAGITMARQHRACSKKRSIARNRQSHRKAKD